jgi:hypothetical protein
MNQHQLTKLNAKYAKISNKSTYKQNVTFKTSQIVVILFYRNKNLETKFEISKKIYVLSFRHQNTILIIRFIKS